MLFNSYQFVFLFLPLSVVLVFACRKVGRSVALLCLIAVSLLFYVLWEPIYVLLLLGSILVNYLLGVRVYDSHSLRFLWFGVIVNLSALAYFKYRYFLAHMLLPMDGMAAAHDVTLVIPLGLSFYTFHQISFLVDCQKRAGPRPENIWEYMLYVTLFPQLIAGPIVRFSEVAYQFRRATAFLPRFDNVAIGLTMFFMGLFKKVVLADHMALYATPIFGLAETTTPVSFIEAWVGVLAYTFQIYFDFSAYSDMALGLARVLGIRLPLNFNSPYRSTSIIEFWRRWHISLSRFLRDYLYFPLGGNRLGPLRRYCNLAVVMALGGMWHGASWNFVMWGGLHGVFLAINHLWREKISLKRATTGGLWRNTLAWTATFLCVSFAWVLFRAETLSGALNLYQGMLGMGGRFAFPAGLMDPAGLPATALSVLGARFVEHWPAGQVFPGRGHALWLALALFICLCLPNTQSWMRWYRPAINAPLATFDRWPRFLLWRPSPLWSTAIILMFLYTALYLGDTGEFIYWQF